MKNNPDMLIINLACTWVICQVILYFNFHFEMRACLFTSAHVEA